MGERNYAVVFQGLMDVLGIGSSETFTKDDPNRPFFFTSAEHLEMIESILDQVSQMQWRECFDVFPLELLFNLLKNKVHGDESLGISITNMFFERGDFDCAPNIACTFHVEKDVPLQCPLSYVKRWYYMFCDHICEKIGIKLIAGVHLPSNTELNPPSAPSSPLRPYDAWED